VAHPAGSRRRLRNCLTDGDVPATRWGSASVAEQAQQGQKRGQVQDSEEPTVPASQLRAIALHLLDERLDEITATAVARVQADEPAYAGSLVSQADLNRYMRRTLAVALIRVLGEPIPDHLATAPSEVGRLRAEQGLALSALLHSYRIDLRILWEAIISEGRARGYAGDKDFLDSCILVWEAVEANIAEVVEAYLRTEETLSRQLNAVSAKVFERLVTEAKRDPSVVGEAARSLRLPTEGKYLVLVADGVPANLETLVASTARLDARRLSFHFGWVREELVGVVLLDGKTAEEVVALLHPLSSWTCGAAVVDGLASVPRGTRLARAVTRSLLGPGVHLLSLHWSAALLASNHELGEAVADDVLGPLVALPPHERAAVFETLEAYLDGEGSVAEVAVRTLRHRNTVTNRLHTVERVTGLSLSKPKDIATLTLAMQWRRTSENLKNSR